VAVAGGVGDGEKLLPGREADHPLHELLRGLPLAAPDDEEEQADDREQHT